MPELDDAYFLIGKLYLENQLLKQTNEVMSQQLQVFQEKINQLEIANKKGGKK